MDILDFIREKFSQDYAVETVLHLVMGEYDLSEEEAFGNIKEYFDIIENV